MLIFALFSFFPQWIAPYSPKDMFEPWAPMSASHWLGTNDMGYDILSELIYAASTTMLVGITASFISLAVGVLVGIAAGYFQGWLGEVINGLIHIFLLIPMLPMTIILAYYAETYFAQCIRCHMGKIYFICGTMYAYRSFSKFYGTGRYHSCHVGRHD